MKPNGFNYAILKERETEQFKRAIMFLSEDLMMQCSMRDVWRLMWYEKGEVTPCPRKP